MTYNGKQLAALIKMGIAMAAADGRFTDEEKIAIAMELANFGVDEQIVPFLLSSAQEMDAAEAFTVLSSMDTEQKKYATGYLAVIMAVDGIEESEINMWKLISTLAGFPPMTIQQALEFWNNH